MQGRRGMGRGARWLAALAATAGFACGAPVEVPALRAPACAASERPARDGMGYRCARAGASAYFAENENGWPKLPAGSSPAPTVHVRASADAGGDGSRERPFRTLPEALAIEATGPRFVLVAEGAYTLTAPLVPTVRVAILGMGPERTRITGAPGTSVLRVEAGQYVGLAGVAVVFPDAMSPGGPAVNVIDVRPGGSFGADNVSIQGMFNRGSTVSIQGMFNAVAVNGGTFDAAGLTVLGANNRAISLTNGASGNLLDVLVRECGAGVVVEDSQLTLSSSLIADTLRGGVAVSRTAAMGSASLDDVAVTGNGVAGVRVEGAGAALSLARVLIADTVVPAGLTGGDGLYVGAGARATLDERDEQCAGMARSAGSRLVGNARAGALVAGAGAQLRACGAGVTENLGPGVFAQRGAVVAALRASELSANTGLGLGVSGGSAARSVLGSAFHATRAGMIATSMGPLALGDGVAVSQGAEPVEFADNELSDNARFAAVFSGGSGVVRANRGAGNRYGLAAYAGGPTLEAGNAVGGRESSPVMAPAFAEQLGAAR